MDCCVHGASRWAVKEGRIGGVGAVGKGCLSCAVFAFSLSLCGSGDSSALMRFGWGKESEEGTSAIRELVPTAEGCTLA